VAEAAGTSSPHVPSSDTVISVRASVDLPAMLGPVRKISPGSSRLLVTVEEARASSQYGYAPSSTCVGRAHAQQTEHLGLGLVRLLEATPEADKHRDRSKPMEVLVAQARATTKRTRAEQAEQAERARVAEAEAEARRTHGLRCPSSSSVGSAQQRERGSEGGGGGR
jgi:hypothetical protein